MKIRLTLLTLAVFFSTSLSAQRANLPALPPRTPDQLDQLVSPIALYPDPLVAIILPATTAPSDVVLAARFVRTNSDPAAIDAQSWDESVRALAHYPELVSWMDENLEWTQQLGAAFVDQPADTMNAIQRLRARAREAGILVDTPQQQVVVQSDYIYVEPAQPDVIYVPYYDPHIFYERSIPRGGRALTFGVAFSTGPWLAFDFDWRQRSIWIDRHRDWSRDWRPNVPVQNPHVQVPAPTVSAERREWHPRIDRSSRQRPVNITINQQVVQPAPFARSAPAQRHDANAKSAPVQARSNSTGPASSPEPVLTPTGRPSDPRTQRYPRATQVPVPATTEPTPPTNQSVPTTESAPVATPAPTAPAPRNIERERGDRGNRGGPGRDGRDAAASQPQVVAPTSSTPAASPSIASPPVTPAPTLAPPAISPGSGNTPVQAAQPRVETSPQGRGKERGPDEAKAKKGNEQEKPKQDEDDERKKRRD